jgi:hypothetical protein
MDENEETLGKNDLSKICEKGELSERAPKDC